MLVILVNRAHWESRKLNYPSDVNHDIREVDKNDKEYGGMDEQEKHWLAESPKDKILQRKSEAPSVLHLFLCFIPNPFSVFSVMGEKSGKEQGSHICRGRVCLCVRERQRERERERERERGIIARSQFTNTSQAKINNHAANSPGVCENNYAMTFLSRWNDSSEPSAIVKASVLCD